MELTYGPPEAEHIPILYGLLEEPAYLPAALEQMVMSREQYRQAVQAVGQVRAIFANGDLAGFYWIEVRGPILHLHGLVLLEGFRGRGIGTVILRQLMDAGGCEAIELGVHKSNTGAIRLYERLGFRTVQVREDVGFLIMQRNLVSVG